MKIVYPLSGKSFEGLGDNSKFGQRWGRKHKGVDLPANVGTRVVSVQDGKVVKVGNFNDNYGGQVLIQHDTPEGTFYSRYAHLRKWYVSPNQMVSQSEKIGESGGKKGDPNAGRSTGPHLHFEILDAGQREIDPAPFLAGSAIASGLSQDTSDDNTDEFQTKPRAGQEGKVKTTMIGDMVGKLVKTAAPFVGLASLAGSSLPESDEKKQNLIEEIDRIKQLLK